MSIAPAVPTEVIGPNYHQQNACPFEHRGQPGAVLTPPEELKMDEDDELVVLIENPDEPLRYEVIAAVNICPGLALLMEE